jgi:hypothetical protein
MAKTHNAANTSVNAFIRSLLRSFVTLSGWLGVPLTGFWACDKGGTGQPRQHHSRDAALPQDLDRANLPVYFLLSLLNRRLDMLSQKRIMEKRPKAARHRATSHTRSKLTQRR